MHLGTKRPLSSPAQLQLVCGAIIFSNVTYAFIAAVLHATGGLPVTGDLAGESGQLYVTLLLVAGISVALMSFVLRKALLSRLPPHPTLQQVGQAMIVATAMGEAAGVFGLVAVLLTGSWTAAGVLWGTGLGVGIFHFPTRNTIENLLAKEA